jgi:hypothetical protein
MVRRVWFNEIFFLSQGVPMQTRKLLCFVLVAAGLAMPYRPAWSQEGDPATEIEKPQPAVEPDDDKFPPPVSSRDSDSEVFPEDLLPDETPPEDPEPVDVTDPALEQGGKEDDEIYLTEEMPREMAAAQSPLCTGTPPPQQRTCSTNGVPANQALPVVPMGIYSANHRYFYFENRPTLLMGVSADNACHMTLGDPNICSPSDYRAILCDASSKGLNKIRLWIEIVGDAGTQHPFKKVGAKWVLDDRNDAYFANLHKVVELAQGLHMAVEITFFAPWEGSSFDSGPWKDGNAKLKNGTLVTGLSNSRQFTTKGNLLAAYQKKVIDWTLDELWCFDNVYWEIANEPETSGTNANTVDLWQDDLITYIRSASGSNTGEGKFTSKGLTAPHLIAVNPFTDYKPSPSSPPSASSGVAHYAAESKVSIFGGHYATLEDDGSSSPGGAPRNRGAIQQIRNQNGVVKIYEFNEGQITQGVPIVNGSPAPVPGQNYDISTYGKYRNRYTRSRNPANGNVIYGSPEPARAEGWEFLLNGGASFDHFGYVYNSDQGKNIRLQVGVMKRFLENLQVFTTLQPTPVNPQSSSWLLIGSDANNTHRPYPTKTTGYSNGSQRFWAAMESPGYTSPTAATRKFLFYVHRSTFRCKATDASDPTYNGSCPSYQAFAGYDARPKTGFYQEKLKLNLGPKPANFTAQWVDPVTGANKGAAIPLSAPCPASGCTVSSPAYDYDLLLKITQNP